MIVSTRAIVLHNMPYNDNYSIACFFAKEGGRVSYLIPRNQKRGKGLGLRQMVSPLNELEIIAEHKPHRDLHFIKEAKLVKSHVHIQFDLTKNSIALFLSEFLYAVLRMPDSDEELYNFISLSLDRLESSDSPANFHLVFLYRMLAPMGLMPDLSIPIGSSCGWFDPADGRFVEHAPIHGRGIPPRESAYLLLFSRITFDNMAAFRLSRTDRRRILDCLIEYYRFHLPNFPLLKTPDILSVLFS